MHTVTDERGLALTTLSKPTPSPALLVEAATEGLARMFDPGQGLFCYRLRKTDNGIVSEGKSHRYTMMCLLGLHRLEQSGKTPPFPIASILEGLLRDVAWVNNIGDLGILLWTCAVIDPSLLKVKGLHSRLEVAQALSSPRYARREYTMEMAWFLTGLCHWSLSCPDRAASLEKLALDCYSTLRRNQGEGGYFGHLGRPGSFAGWLRGRIGSFADQVYPIYGMTRLWQAFGNEEAKEAAISCAQALCREQGALGQWWWHYDSVTGQVVDEYPVFSVHQHAMGPMTLLALGDAIGRDFTPWIAKGLNWIHANNELKVDMEDRTGAVIWRCIYSPSFQWYGKWNAFLHRGHRTAQRSEEKLRVLFECRSYELGWLLYAFANRTPNWLTTAQ